MNKNTSSESVPSIVNENSTSKLIPANLIYQSYRKGKGIVAHTPLTKSSYLSKKYNAKIYLKR
jgi:threonine dehydratase